METYLCQLIDRKGFVSECFYRRGESAEEVLRDIEALSLPNVPRGATWRVETQEEREQRIQEEQFDRL